VPVSFSVRDIQTQLLSRGFNPGDVDGKMGPQTRRAIEAFQRANGLGVDGVVGRNTGAALFGEVRGSDTFEPARGRSYSSRGTGYFPDASPMEGGFVDRIGRPLHTLQDHLAGRASYVSVAMDSSAFPYGTKLRIPELEAKYGRPIEFRVVDTGGAFRGKGTSRIDICTENRRASLDPTINGPLTLIPS
jgi:3D (Asp-Asp-Asp) domain-containing protein